MEVYGVNWTRLNAARFGLGLLGALVGLLLGALFVFLWHWFVVVILFLFGIRPAPWSHLLGGLFVLGLLAEGYVYKARMPPPSPFRNATALTVKMAVGIAPVTPRQAGYGVSEILYVAPRLFFWGVRHWGHIVLPSAEVKEAAQRLLAELQACGTWVAAARLLPMIETVEVAGAALATLVRAGLAVGRSDERGVAFCAWQPEWV